MQNRNVGRNRPVLWRGDGTFSGMALRDPKSLCLNNDPSIEVLLRRSARARRYTLRVSQLDGRVTLTLPARASLQDGIAFINDKADWIAKQVAGQGGQTVIGIGYDVPFEGRAHALTVSSKHRSIQVEAGEIFLPERHQDRPAPAIKAFLKQAARDRLAAACDQYADQIGCTVGRITLRDTRSRWGSCTYRGDLMFSWRLIMAPPAVLRYVAAHEVAHLIEMNHSPDFWAVVAEVCPDYQAHRAWLRQHGAQLHRVVFPD